MSTENVCPKMGNDFVDAWLNLFWYLSFDMVMVTGGGGGGNSKKLGVLSVLFREYIQI